MSARVAAATGVAAMMRRGAWADPDVGRAKNASAAISRATGKRCDRGRSDAAHAVRSENVIAVRIIGCKPDAETAENRAFRAENVRACLDAPARAQASRQRPLFDADAPQDQAAEPENGERPGHDRAGQQCNPEQLPDHGDVVGMS